MHTSFLLGPNVLLSTLSSNSLSLCSSLNVTDQVPHPYKTTGKIRIVYIIQVKQSRLMPAVAQRVPGN
jgi:hypothetical protein